MVVAKDLQPNHCTRPGNWRLIQGGIIADYALEHSTRIENVSPALPGSWQPKYQQNSDQKRKKKPVFDHVFKDALKDLPEESTMSFYV